MGYTHYWERQKRYSRQDFNKVILDCHKLISYYSNNATHFIPYGGQEFCLADGSGDCMDKHEFIKANSHSSGFIRFNGCTKDFNRLNGSHETFMFDRVTTSDHSTARHPIKKTTKFYFECCKTARKPYDLMVCACLIIMKYHLQRDITVRSDGEADDWEHAVDFVNDIVFNPGTNGVVDRVTFATSDGYMFIKMDDGRKII